ncbi:MAG: integration host factor subunit alpha [Psychromonas sp.]|nr:integration host factor subunit alpha [Psychromonas sp.]
MTLTKAKVALHLSETIGLSKRDAKQFVEFFFEEIKASLANGEAVKITGFGGFDLKNKRERPGRNPKTGEDVSISARRIVRFKSGQKLKEKIEESLQ